MGSRRGSRLKRGKTCTFNAPHALSFSELEMRAVEPIVLGAGDELWRPVGTGGGGYIGAGGRSGPVDTYSPVPL